MTHPTSILKFILPIVLALANLPSAFSQNCPFGNGDLIALEGNDIHDQSVPLFIEETDLEVKNVSIGQTVNDKLPGKLLRATYTTQDGKTNINIFAKQLDFMIESDYHGFERGFSGSPVDGLQIEVEGGETLRCMLSLVIHDTNNLAPLFNASKDEFEFTVTTAWDKKGAPLNWKIEDRILVTDWDRTKVTPTFIIDPPQKLNIKGVLTELPGELEHANVWDVKFFVDGDFVEDTYDFSITPTDGVNPGTPIHVVLKVDEVSLFEPVFTSGLYSKKLDKMPKVGEVLDVTPECVDPDDLMNGRVSKFEYSLTSDQGVTEYLDFVGGTSTLQFKAKVPEVLMGKTVKASITAKKVTSKTNAAAELPTKSELDLTFPQPAAIKFPTNTHVEKFTNWPVKNGSVTLPGATHDDKLILFYDFKSTKPPYISLDKNVIKFEDNLEPGMLGEFEENRMVIFEVVASYGYADFVEFGDEITVVFTFPRDDTTELPTTVQDCETCEPCPTTGNPTTDLTTECSCGTTDVSEVTCPTTPPECPPPTTCEPGGVTDSTGVTSTDPCVCVTDSTCPTPEPCDSICPSTEPCDCSTDNPYTTPQPCDCSSSTPETPTTCPSLPTPEPCDCSSDKPCTTPEPCDCSSSTPETPTTCPTCTTPEPCDCDTSPTTCPTPEPCDCESSECEPSDNDCSTTGLVIAVITTSILCACSILAGGYCLWLLRKATLDPTKMPRDSFAPDVISNQPPTNPELPDSEYTTPHRFSFGDETTDYSSRFVAPTTNGSVEPGFSNPNFTNDVGVVDPVVPTTSETTQRKKSSIKPPKDIEPDYEESPKKSNMKAPKEIEPDYEEVAVTSDPVSNESAKQSRVIFAPEDEYISIDGGSNVVEGGGSDIEDERL